MLIKVSAYRKMEHGDVWCVVSQVNIAPEGHGILRDSCPQLVRDLFEDDLSVVDVLSASAWAVRQLLTRIDSGQLEDPGAALRVARQLSVLNCSLIANPRGGVEVSL